MSDWRADGIEVAVGGFRLGPLDLALEAGRAVAVVGPSGAGKTTLLRALAGFLPIERGRLWRDGVDLTRAPPEARGLGYVPQGLGLFPHRTVFHNVRYPLEIAGTPDPDPAAEALLDRFRLRPLADRRPAALSGGEQQRVALARALAADPELIVWDEPGQALDVEARHDLGGVLADLRAVDRVPIVVVTHDPALAFSVADEFVVLDRGRLLLRADAASLLRHPPTAFVARFAGYENVLDRPAVDRAGDGPFARWLRGRAGPEGVAFRALPVPAPEAPRGAWDGVVRAARPDPDGIRLEIAADDLMLAARLPRAWSAPLPAAGSRVRFDVPSDGVRPLDGAAAP